MSNAIFPVMPGLAWNVGKSPSFNTLAHRAASGRELRVATMQYPLWKYSLTFEVLRQDTVASELQTLCGFFLARQGSFDSFLYSDPNDNLVTTQSFGTGDGTTTQFQLIRAWGLFAEPVMNVNVITNVKVNGATKILTTDYSVSATGVVTFVVAPPASATITWTGTYYYRVRFLLDNADFNQMLSNLWELKKLEFVGSTGNKV